MPVLVIMRHAKAAWPDGVPDHQRPLAARGRRDAPVAGDWIRQRVGPPDRIVCSTAVRTRQTLELASAAWPGDCPVEFTDELYDASVADLIDVAATAPESCRVQLLVSHNPTCAQTVLTLADRLGPLASAVEEKFPTSAVAVLQVPDWASLRPGSASLIDVAVPRG